MQSDDGARGLGDASRGRSQVSRPSRGDAGPLDRDDSFKLKTEVSSTALTSSRIEVSHLSEYIKR